jgi:hypothetical protein
MIVFKKTRRFSGSAYSVRREGELICSASDEQVMIATMAFGNRNSGIKTEPASFR